MPGQSRRSCPGHHVTVKGTVDGDNLTLQASKWPNKTLDLNFFLSRQEFAPACFPFALLPNSAT